VQIKIPYESGMDPTSGLVDLFESVGKLKKIGNKLEYTSPVTGEITLKFRKKYESNEDNILHIIMNEFDTVMPDAPDTEETDIVDHIDVDSDS